MGLLFFDLLLLYGGDDRIASRSASTVDRLRGAGLRPTRQRLALARLLFDKGHRHVSAEQLHGEAVENEVRVVARHRLQHASPIHLGGVC